MLDHICKRGNIVKEFKNNIPRPEYPRPQMIRSEWINLNGEWDFEIDYGKSGKERKLFEQLSLNSKITVPFCPESKLSGVENKDFLNAVWYQREFEIPHSWLSGRILIHFGAVDYYSEVWVNGIFAGKHRGGYTSFSFDITELLKEGKNSITVYAEDDTRSGLQPKGKQSSEYYSHGCDYTRTTGIWQTVWLESVPTIYLSRYRLTPDPLNSFIHITAAFEGDTSGCTFRADAFFSGINTGCSTSVISGKNSSMSVKLASTHLWEPGNPELYDLKLSIHKGDSCIDSVEGYFGLRTVSLGEDVILINGKPVFQRLVLDQGFYPDGIYTAPTDEDLKKDIEISMGLGFNGARMHEKVFDPRYIYWADKSGYLVWGEYANWGLDITTSAGLERFLPEWLEAIERDFNHPSVIGWCPFNETWDMDGTKQDDEVLRIVYNATKLIDNTRPIIDTSGNFHVVTDIFDVHDYEQDPDKFAEKFEPMKNGGDVYVTYTDRQKYGGQPYFVSEYGGIWWNPDQKDDKSWGYGSRPETRAEFIDRYERLTNALLDNPRICAFCYTQLYDVEQEVNGLYTYYRKPKFDQEIIRKINTRVAAVENKFLDL